MANAHDLHWLALKCLALAKEAERKISQSTCREERAAQLDLIRRVLAHLESVSK
jgi:hypothetical protein